MRQRVGRRLAAVIAAAALVASAASADPVDLTPPPPAGPGVAAPPVASPPAATGRSVGSEGFVFADSDRRELTPQEIARVPCDRLEIARNEIFARRGRHFQRPDLTRYFSQFGWYKPTTWNPVLSPVERENVRLLAQAQHRC